MKRKSFLVFSFLIAGVISSLLNAEPGDLVWAAETGGIIFGSPGIGPMGEIVVGSYDRKTYSFNPDSSLRWISAEVGDWIDASPTIASDGTVYVGSWDNHLYALDGNTGALKWSFETGGFIIASPAIGPDGTIYVGSNDGFLYAIHPSGSLKWFSDKLPVISPINSSSVLNHSGDTVYFGTDTGNLYALSTSDGTVRWSFSVTDFHPPSSDADYGISGAVAIDEEGNLYFGCENTYFYALDYSGNLKWHYKAADSIRSSAVISNSNIVHFAAQDGYLYFLDTEGIQIWETYIGDVLYCSPAIDALGNIIIAGYAGSEATGSATDFTCVNPSGEILWEYHINGVNDSSPNIAPDGSIYIGANDGKLYKLEGYAGLTDGVWPRVQANRRQTGWVPDLAEAELLDYFPLTTSSANGWAFVPWFGSGWLAVDELPWIQHLDHGLIYLDRSLNSGASWFYDPGLKDWIYATSVAPYYYYQYGIGAWLFHVPGTTVDSGRWFYDFGIAGWKTVTP